MAERILIVDDEADLLKLVDFNLKAAGFETLTSQTGQMALDLAREEQPDLIILDLMLPDIQGTEVCRTLRQGDRTRLIPIVILTAKGDEIDRVVGFELGADDYVVKPFSVRELVLRVRAILKRRPQPSSESSQPLSGRSSSSLPKVSSGDEPIELRFGPIALDEVRHRVWVDGDEVRLTAREFKLLRTFLKNQGAVQTRDRLLEEVWGSDVTVTTRTVDTHVKRLREKLGNPGRYIETVRGVGYRFAEHPDPV